MPKLVLPQPNGSQITIPNIPNYRRVFEAYGFDVVRGESRSLLMERRCPDDNGYDGAWQARAELPAEFAAEIQRVIQVVS